MPQQQRYMVGTTGNTQVSSEQVLWRSNFTGATQPDPAVWATTNDNGDHIVTRGGNSSGASYLRISLNPLAASSEVRMYSVPTFLQPIRVGFGVSISQRMLGQEMFFGILADDGSGGVDASLTPTVADLTLPASVTITTNVATIVINNHGLQGGDRVELLNCPDSRLNVSPVVVTVVDVNTFTVPITLANGTYTSTAGSVRFVDPVRYASNAGGYLFENTTVTNASLVQRRNGRKFRSLNASTATTAAVQSNTSPYTDAFNASCQLEMDASIEEIRFRAYVADGTGAMSGLSKFTQGTPDESLRYHLAVRARNLGSMTRPNARITAIAKTGTTTATVTTDVAHGYTTSDWIQVIGVADQVNFPNLAVQTQVASVVDATHFTIVIGGAVTASSSGGFVARVQGSQVLPGAANTAVASIACTVNGILAVTLAGTPVPLPLPGEYWQLHGLQGGAATYDGGYKVLRAVGTALELEAPSVTTFGSITTGGGLLRRTDVRVHFARADDFNRVITEISGGRGNANDINNSVPVTVTAAPTTAVTQSTGSATATSAWQVGQPSGVGVVDVVSAALTVTTTTAAITPGAQADIGHGAYVVQVAVTAVSGTTPTLDVVVQESVDAGTNWKDVYHFERITANGSYTSPQIRLQEGSQIRYVQTVGGTTPSFTRSIRRNYFNLNAPVVRRFFDRTTIVLTTLNSTTPAYDVKGCDTIQLSVNVGAVTTTAPQFVIEGSEDGANWYQLSATPLTAVASATVQQTMADLVLSFVRARVSTAGVGVTAGYVCLKTLGR